MTHDTSKPQTSAPPDFGPLTITVRLIGDRVVTVSAFCPLCLRRRAIGGAGGHGGVGGGMWAPGMAHTRFVSWRNPCGHTDYAEALVVEESLQCARAGCVLLVSDECYPFCSPECAGAAGRACC